MSADASQAPETQSLLPQHERYLVDLGITPALIARRGCYSATHRDQLKKLGFQCHQADVPCLVIPVFVIEPNKELHLVRPDVPRKRKTRVLTFEQPKGTGLRLDIPPESKDILGDASIQLWIGDSPLHADALIAKGALAIGLLNPMGWRHFHHRERQPLAEWNQIALKGRDVVIAFSKEGKPATYEQYTAQFKQFLEQQGARVQVAMPAIGELASVPKGILQPNHPYVFTDDGMFMERLTDEGSEYIRLTNWAAKVVKEILQDDGVEQHRLFELEARMGGEVFRFRLTPLEFAEMKWPLEKLGIGASMAVGYGINDHVRSAIQHNSFGVAKIVEYGHTGFVRHDGRWVFLHADGAISGGSQTDTGQSEVERPSGKARLSGDLRGTGPIGPLSGSSQPPLQAHLPPGLQNFSLPPPPTGDLLIGRILRTIQLVETIGPHIALPLVAGAFRAVLGANSITIHLAGDSGALKSSLACVVQQFFGANFDLEHIAGHWSGTANSLEALAYRLKDVLLLVDDFAPNGSRADIQRLHRQAEQLIRAKANYGGRSRSTSTGGYLAPRVPKALLLMTGEDIPIGKSLRARMLTVNVGKEDIDSVKLSFFQQAASHGVFSGVMAAFIGWLSDRFDEIQLHFTESRESWRREPPTVPHVHRRVLAMTQELEYAFWLFLKFAEESGAVDATRREELDELACNTLIELACAQDAFIMSADPVDSFPLLIESLFAAHRVHLVDLDTGGAPLMVPEAWGYRKQTIRVPVDDSSDPKHEISEEDEPDESGRECYKDSTGRSDRDPCDKQPIQANTAGEQKQKVSENADQNSNPGTPNGSASDVARWTTKEVWVGTGKRMGWMTTGWVYFIPEVLFDEIYALAHRNGVPIPYTPQVLEMRLADRGFFLRDEKRGRVRRRITADGARISVLQSPVHEVRWLFDVHGLDKEQRKDLDEMLLA